MELITRAGQASQTHAFEAMMDLQVRKAHLYFLALITRLFKLGCAGAACPSRNTNSRPAKKTIDEQSNHLLDR